MSLDRVWRRCGLVAVCLPLVLLAGCPQQDTDTAGKAPAQATAPEVAQQGANDATGSEPVAKAMTTAQANEAAANSYKAQQLINQAETTYARGVASYRAGRVDAARMDFDLAVDTMLSSSLDVKGDPQLSDELDRLLDKVNALEMDALKQGNGLSPTLEAAPIDEAANDLTFPANPELTAKLQKELTISTSDLPLVINDQVAGYIAYFANSPTFHAHMLRSMERAGKYKGMMQKVLKEEGVPQDLIYLAVAESGFQPQALNPKSGAGGIWQFMPTGAYGLARNGWVDERFDPEKSTRAYARYMKSVYNLLGDWYLAMAGYDWGPGNVQKAVMRTGYADFWELYRRNALPAETRAYIPQVLAAIIMAKNPEKYGLNKMVPMPEVVFDTVAVNGPVDLRLVADVTDASLEEIVALNPSLLRMRTPAEMEFDLHVPVGTSEVYAQRMKLIPEDKRAAWRFHTVKPGESLDGIAAKMHGRASEIAETNGLSLSEAVVPGDELVIPVAASSSAAGLHQARYIVRRGDTLVTVADRFNVSVEELRRWNHLAGAGSGASTSAGPNAAAGRISAGRSLAVSEPVKLAPAMHARGRGSRGRRHDAAAASGKAASSKAHSRSAVAKKSGNGVAKAKRARR